MNPLQMISPGDQGPSLLSIIIDVAFGFVGGLMLFVGFSEVITYGSKLTLQLIKTTGYGQQMAMFGVATNAVPYIVLAPLTGIVGRQLSSVKSLKGFMYFAAAVAVGVAVAFVTKGMIFPSIV